MTITSRKRNVGVAVTRKGYRGVADNGGIVVNSAPAKGNNLRTYVSEKGMTIWPVVDFVHTESLLGVDISRFGIEVLAIG